MNSIQHVIGIARNTFARTVLVLLAVLCSDAFAAAPIVQWTTGTSSGQMYLGAYYADKGTACSALAAKVSGQIMQSATIWKFTGAIVAGGGDPTNNCYLGLVRADGSGGTSWNGYVYASKSLCANGANPDTMKPLANQCPDPGQEKCAGYDTVVAAATAYQYLSAPISCTTINGAGISTCTGTDSSTGKQSSQDIACGSGAAGSGTGAKPDPVPNPPPATDVDYPKCPVGTYKYTDIDGSTSCSRPERPDDAQPCASGNVGTINGRYTCLPSNPAPNVAKSAADAAQAKEQTAKSNPGTDAAKAAATGAAADAQRATDAANSLPSSDPASGGTVTDAARAVNAAKQAAGYAGSTYTGPGGPANGTDTTPKECGTPGRPKCQIDETGTPTGIGSALDKPASDLDKTVDSVKDGANGAVSSDGKDTSLGGWMPQLPQGACAPLGIEDYFGNVHTIDICQYVPYVTAGFELLWCAFFAFAVMSMVAAATSKSTG